MRGNNWSYSPAGWRSVASDRKVLGPRSEPSLLSSAEAAEAAEAGEPGEAAGFVEAAEEPEAVEAAEAVGATLK